jgi:hypothetical protein
LWWRKTQIYRRNRILKIVDLVTSVSKNNVDILSKINTNTRLVSNGFDSEFFFSKLQKESQSFKIIYGGKLYEEKRFQDPEMFFQALAAIKDRFKSYHIVSNFFVEGNCRDVVRSYSEKYNITDMIRFYDLLETSEYAVQIRQSQLGVIFANPLSRGVIPTKFYEYIGSGLPVMLVPDDEGDIASILREKKLGLAAKSVDQIVDFIKNVYELWAQNKPVVIEADRVEEFERRVLSAQFVEIAKNLVTKIYE